jgi:hypothetical protein
MPSYSRPLLVATIASGFYVQGDGEQDVVAGGHRFIHESTHRFEARPIHASFECVENVAEVKFRALASEWKRATAHLSVLNKRYKHPSYQAILQLGPAIVPFVLNELRREPDFWFEALEELTGANPAKGAQTFYEAVDRWIAWGIANEQIA